MREAIMDFLLHLVELIPGAKGCHWRAANLEAREVSIS